HAAVVERYCAAGAVARARGRLGLGHAQARRIARHQQRGDSTFADACPYDEQRRQRCADDAVLAAADDPAIARAHRGRLERRAARLRSVIIDAERGIAIRLVLGEREVIALAREERWQ